MGSIPVAGAKKASLAEAFLVPARRPHLRKRSEAELGSHTPPEDRQARLSGAGREYIRQGRNSRTEEEKASLAYLR